MVQLTMPRQLDPDLILTLRQRVRLTQAQFALQLLVDRVTVSRWERGLQSPSRIHVKQMRDKWSGVFSVLRKGAK